MFVFTCSSPVPQKSKSRKRKQAPAEDNSAVPGAPAETEGAAVDVPADTDDAFHAAAADLFRVWLSQHKAQLAEEEEASIQAPSLLSVCFW